MEINFSGKRALVTGAGKGIGRSTVKMLAKCGAEVIAVSRTQADLDSLKTEVPSISTVCIDITNNAAMSAVIEELGDIHLLVNNAGVAVLEPFLEVKEDHFDRMFAVNVKAVLFLSQVIAKKMIAGGFCGSIVNVSSQASQRALKNHTVYCTTKSALDMLTKMMALELGPQKIRVNAVNPTVVMTEMGKMAWSKPAVAEPMLKRIPLGKFAEEEDIVHAILYLLSNKAEMVNGVTLQIDGGFLIN